MQLQGELVKGGGTKVYKNAIDVLVKTYRNEGLRGVQRGLGPAVRTPASCATYLLTRHPTTSTSTRYVVGRCHVSFR